MAFNIMLLDTNYYLFKPYTLSLFEIKCISTIFYELRKTLSHKVCKLKEFRF